MKKPVFFISVLSVMAAGFLLTSMAKNRLVSEKGHINYYGNAPVETPAFRTDGGKIYLMEVDASAKCTMEEILSHQGEYLELTGIIEPAGPGIAFPISQDGTIVISSYKPAK